MSILVNRKFSFYSGSGTDDSFFVVRFTGEAALSKPYHFTIHLLTTDATMDPEKLVNRPARFIIHRDDQDVTFHGIVTHAEYDRTVQEYAQFTVELAPRFSWLSHTHHNQVFLDQDVKTMLSGVLKDARIESSAYDFRLQQDHPGHKFVCQYGESHFNFINRWCEREGIYYYFDHSQDTEKVIFTDTRTAHAPASEGTKVIYSTPSGLDNLHRDEVVRVFSQRKRLIPQKVTLRDYNFEKPTLPMIGEADVDQNGRGEMTTYGEYFLTPDEGTRLAKIRAEELACRKDTYYGESSVPYILPGFVFEMTGHYRDALNRSFLTTDIHMEGDQVAYFVAGLKNELSEVEKAPYYRNTFTAIPSDIQFRPEIKTPKARINGTIQGWIDSAGSGQYAELDEQGRYKVIFPFDLSDRKDGKASTWLRRIQPYGGSGHGMHMPLHRGAEVLIAFTNGDPDRPIIAGSAPNPRSPSLVDSDNQTRSRLRSSSGNELHFEDKQGEERIQFHVPATSSFLRIGAPNDPPPGMYTDQQSSQAQGEALETIAKWFYNLHKNFDLAPDLKKHGITLGAGAKLEIEAATKNSLALIEKMVFIGGFEEKINTPFMLRFLGGRRDELECTSHTDNKWVHTDMNELHNKVNGLKTNISETKETISESTSKIDGIKQTVAETEERLEGSRSLVAGAETKMTQAKEKIDGTKEYLNDLKTTIADSLDTIRINEAGMKTCVDEMAEMNTEVAGQKTAVSTIKSQMAEMQQLMTTLQSAMSALHSVTAEILEEG